MRYHKAIERIVAKYTKLAEDRYAADYDRQQVCYEFVEWLNEQRESYDDRDVESVALVEEEEWALFCEVEDVDPKRKVHRKYGFDALNYDNDEL
ncbi:MAG: hypothetical protein E7147_06050 [Rikenellaceae bacterium]|nr:hypothetical protein [Rikenellaceae bacterium]